MKVTQILKFDRVAGFYPDLNGLIPEGAVMERKSLGDSALVPTEAGDGYLASLSTTSVDRDGDIVLQEGIMTDYYTGVLLWNHELTKLPIGRCENIARKGTDTLGTLHFAEDYDFAEDVHSLVRQRMLRGISIGYIPLKVANRGTREFNEAVAKYNLDPAGCHRILLKVELIEVSVCAVGVNRDTLIQALATKSFCPVSEAASHALGLDDPLIQRLVALETRLIALEDALASSVKPAEQVGEVDPDTGLEALETGDEGQKAADEPLQEALVAEEVAHSPDEVATEEVVTPPAGAEEVEEAKAKTALQFKVIRKGGYTVDTSDIEAKAKALVRGRLV